MDNRTEEIKLIFSEAYKKKVPLQRKVYLDKKCGVDSDLRAEVESLLKSYDDADGFLDAPVLNADVTLDNSVVSEGPGTVIGRYKLLEKIGEGGMAVVYMAEQQHPIRRKVALKIIKLGMDTKSVIARFEAERQALAMMDHPNIAKVFDAGAAETGRPYFVMELVTGISITEYCDKSNLSTKERLAMFIQVCNAVQHAHQKGIIHRDIKPTNVMVALHDDSAVPKVIDFGIARATNQKLTEKTLFTRYAQMIGTPAYMSPEQAEFSDSKIDMRTDIYSLGVLLYELLTGTTPFGEDELHNAGYLEMQRIICHEVPMKPSTKLSTLGETMTDVVEYRKEQPNVLRKLIRGDLDWIVMKALEKDRTRRYETVYDLAMDIERHLSDKPVMAGPPSIGYRLHKFIRRNRVAVAAVALVTGATLMGATAAKLGVLTFPGFSGRPQHAAGMVQRHVWDAPPESDLCGGISHDGRYLSYTDWAAGNLAARDMTSKTNWLVTKNTDSTWKTIDGWADNSVISPDGRQIAYSWHNENGLNFYDLRIIDLDGSNMRVLYHDASIFYIEPYTWSPDGRNILVYFSEADKSLVDGKTGELFRKSYLALVSVADGSVRILRTWHANCHPSKAVFSPDGRYVAYDFGQEDDLTHYDIYLIDLKEGSEIPLIEHRADDRLFGWALDGGRILFASNRTSERSLWVIDIDQGAAKEPPRLLKDAFIKGSPIGFTSDGSYYYGISTTANNVYLVRLDSAGVGFEGEPELVSSQFVGSTTMADWSPNGKRLVYRTSQGANWDGPGNWILVVYSVETSQEVIVIPSPPFREYTHMRGPRFSPDGRLLLVLGTGQESGKGLYTVDVETGAATMIDSVNDRFSRQAVWSPDGKSIYVRSWKSLHRLNLATKQKTELYQVKEKEETRGLDVSPDGQWLSFYRDIHSLAVMPSSGGEPREVVHMDEGELMESANFVRWTPDGEHLLFGKCRNELWKINVETGEQQQIAVIGQDLTSAVMHPDGRRIAITTQQAGSQLWVMENFLPEQ